MLERSDEGKHIISSQTFEELFNIHIVNDDVEQVNTMYKNKATKVRPSNQPCNITGEPPGGRDDWFERDQLRNPYQEPSGRWKEFLIPRFNKEPEGYRLTPERTKAIDCGDLLTDLERDMLMACLLNREGALAFDWTHAGRVQEDVAPPQRIRTVPHEAWQTPGFPVPKALVEVVSTMLRDRIKQGVFEPCDGPYRNPWFLVKKKTPGAYRIINAVVELNRHTIRDANLPPDADAFAENFAGCTVASLIDFFSGYDQIPLALESRDLTAFQTPLGLLRYTTLPQGATNSVAQFCRIIMKILGDLTPSVAISFLDDIGIKGPKTVYDNKEIVPGVRKFVLEHIQAIDKTLERLERAGCAVGAKSKWCYDGMEVVGYVVGSEGRKPVEAKIKKILDWPEPKSATEVRMFLGVCVYYRIWVEKFAQKAEPLYRLLKKDVEFSWTIEQEQAMKSLKENLIKPPTLMPLDYGDTMIVGQIVLGVDASIDGWGAHLGQESGGKRTVARFESGLWNDAEKNYDATKRECRGVLKALRKCRFDLYGIHFVLETDAKVLVAQLNRAATDLPGALVTRWIAWIRLFDFEVRHVKGTAHTAADGLSRRPATLSDVSEEDKEEDIDEWIADQLNNVEDVSTIHNFANFSRSYELDKGYNSESRKIAQYLTSLQRPEGMTSQEFSKFKKRALGFSVREGCLYRNGTRDTPHRKVIDEQQQRTSLIGNLHEAYGHKGVESTFDKVHKLYYWNGMYEDVKRFVKSCPNCQKRQPNVQEEPLHPTWVSTCWQKCGLDIMYMPPDNGYKYLVSLRDDLSGWIEAKPLRNATSQAVAAFIWNVVCRHSVFGKVSVDGGPENKAHVEYFLRKYGIKRVQISAYNSKANGQIERGHRPIADGLAKVMDGKSGWLRHLDAMLFADRVTTHRPTNLTPFYVIYGRHPVLPIETQYSTWRVLDWEKVTSREDLLALRLRQLEMHDLDMEEAVMRKKRYRLDGKARFDKDNNVIDKKITAGDIVLQFDPQSKIDMSRERKLGYRWLGPYRVNKVLPNKSTYILEEMDGTPIDGTYSGARLKKFVKREGEYIPVGGEEEDTGDITEDELEDPLEALLNPRRSERIAQRFTTTEDMIDHIQENQDVTPPTNTNTRVVVEIPAISPSTRRAFPTVLE